MAAFDWDLDSVAKFLARKLDEIEEVAGELYEFGKHAVDVNTDLFREGLDEVRDAWAKLSDEAHDAGGNPENVDGDPEAAVRDNLDNH